MYPITAVIIRGSQEESETEKKAMSHAWKIKEGSQAKGDRQHLIAMKSRKWLTC